MFWYGPDPRGVFCLLITMVTFTAVFNNNKLIKKQKSLEAKVSFIFFLLNVDVRIREAQTLRITFLDLPAPHVLILFFEYNSKCIFPRDIVLTGRSPLDWVPYLFYIFFENF
jgi:hypothetical protein